MTVLVLAALAQAAKADQSWFAVGGMIAGLLGGLTGVAALVTGFANRRKTLAEGGKLDAERTQIYADVALEMLAPSREQVAFLRSELASAQSEVVTLRKQVGELTREVETLRQIHGGSGWA